MVSTFSLLTFLLLGSGYQSIAIESRRLRTETDWESRSVKANESQCDAANPSRFSIDLLLDVNGRPGEISQSDLEELQAAFKDAYNSVSTCGQKGAVRAIDNVRILQDAVDSFGIIAGSNRLSPGSVTRKFTWLIGTEGRCSGCGDTLNLFSDPSHKRHLKMPNESRELKGSQRSRRVPYDKTKGKKEKRASDVSPEPFISTAGVSASENLNNHDSKPAQSQSKGGKSAKNTKSSNEAFAKSLNGGKSGKGGKSPKNGLKEPSSKSGKKSGKSLKGKKSSKGEEGTVLCYCPPPDATRFLAAFNLRVTQRAIHGFDDASNAVELQQTRCTKERKAFRGSMTIFVRGDLGLKSTDQIRVFEEAVVQTYNAINALGSEICDPCFRELTIASATLGIDSFPSRSLSVVEDERILLPSKVTFAVSLSYKVSSSGEGCSAGNLFDSGNVGNRRELSSPFCLCPMHSFQRGPTELDFLVALNQTVQILVEEGSLSFIQEVLTSAEVVSVPCSSDIVYFTSSFSLELYANPQGIPDSELVTLADLFVTAYNNVARNQYCDPFFRTVVDASVTKVFYPSTNGTRQLLNSRFASLAALLQTTGQCRGCPRNSKLTGQVSARRELSFEELVIGDYRDLQFSGQDVCYCNSNVVNKQTAPSQAAVLKEYAKLVQGAMLPDIQTVTSLRELGQGADNGECAFAVGPLKPLSPIFGSTSGAAVKDNLPGCIDQITKEVITVNGPGVWYVLSGQGTAAFVTTCLFGLDFDTIITVYKGSCSDLVCVGANDDVTEVDSKSPNWTVEDLCSTVGWFAEEGITYYVLVHGPGLASGFSKDHASANLCSGNFRLLYEQEYPGNGELESSGDVPPN